MNLASLSPPAPPKMARHPSAAVSGVAAVGVTPAGTDLARGTAADGLAFTGADAASGSAAAPGTVSSGAAGEARAAVLLGAASSAPSPPASGSAVGSASPPASNVTTGPASPTPPTTARDSLTAVILVVILGVLMQGGSALSVLVIGAVGVIEALWLRTFFAAVILAVVRPRAVRWPVRGNRLLMGGLTLSLLAMNLCFYEAISRAPVGVVVAVEFLGPLGIAVAGSRRWLDAIWVVLAGVGVFVLADPSGSVSTAGLLFSLASAACWAAFLLLAKAAVTRMEPLQVTTLMLIGSAVLLTPVLLATGVKVAGQGYAILLGLAVAVLSSALPYLLEMSALKRVRASTYGVLLSLEPGIAAFMGFVILAQRLTFREIGGIAAVVVAAAGASWAAARLSRTRVRRPQAR